MSKSLELERLQLGVCYYPEHWPESLWADDYQRMKELGFPVVRLAEFAWSIFEPEEGVFSFELFDRVVGLAHEHGLEVILGTPTATPSAWLTHKYPEVLNVTQARGAVSTRDAPPHHLQRTGVPRALGPHRPPDGRALRRPSGGHRLAT